MTHVYFDKEIETASREKIEGAQFVRLKKMLDLAYRENPFYRKKLIDHGISPKDIGTMEDITKLPYLYKKEIQEDQRINPPFGTNLTGSMENFVRYHQTTGTTGIPVRWLDTKETWNWRGRCAAMSLTGPEITAKDIIFFPFAFGPHVAYWGIWEGVWEIGALAIAGGGWNTLQRLKSIFENQVTVVACTPTYAIRMAEVARENGIDLRESSVRITFHAGEPGALIPSVRDKIIESWGAKPFDYPGLTEVGAYGIHCVAQDTSIHVNEGEFIFELIDPKTGIPVNGEGTGEMVLTNLGRSSSPSIRFRTGDMVNVKKSQCSCGRTFVSLEGGIIGRVDGMISLRGMNIFPSQVEAVVGKHLLIGEDFQIVAYTAKGMGELKVKCELLDGRSDEILSEIQKDLLDSAEIRVGVERVPKGTIERSDYKSKKFVDMREK
jgi:phenylacetate-CoA ligase